MLAQNSPSLRTTPNKTEISKQTRTTPNNLEIFKAYVIHQKYHQNRGDRG